MYNRCCSGEKVFEDPEEAAAFLELLHEVKVRDDLLILAWCLMSNHFHLAVRTSAIPLARTMCSLQGGFSRGFNRRWRRTGPLWQSRYKARLVDEQRYFDQLLCYIHLNPLRAGVVEDPADHEHCGHREILGHVKRPLIDADDVLAAFGEKQNAARREYVKRINAVLASEERAEVSERLPWWTENREVKPTPGRAYVDVLGRSTGPEKPALEVMEYLQEACVCLGTSIDELASGGKGRHLTGLRYLVATLGIERWRQRAGALGEVLGKHPDVVSRWARMGGQRRRDDRDFAQRLDELDTKLSTPMSSCTSS